MKTTITGRKVSITPKFTERTEKKLSKLDKFFDSAASADVTVSNERNKQRVEITIRCNGLLFRAEEAAEDPNEAVDKLVDVLLRQGFSPSESRPAGNPARGRGCIRGNSPSPLPRS